MGSNKENAGHHREKVWKQQAIRKGGSAKHQFPCFYLLLLDPKSKLSTASSKQQQPPHGCSRGFVGSIGSAKNEKRMAIEANID